MTQPSDSNYWLRIDRVNGTNFNFYQKALDSAPWQLIGGSPVVRSDLASLTLQVGIEHASFNSTPDQAQFDTFRLFAIPEPAAATLTWCPLALRILLKRRKNC